MGRYLDIGFRVILEDFESQVGAKLEASWPSKSMTKHSKNTLTFAHRAADVPGGSRARNDEFSVAAGWADATGVRWFQLP